MSKLHLINIENKKLIEIKVADDYQVESAAWSPDGKNIIFSSGPADGIIGQNDIYRVSFDDLLSPNQPPLEKLTDTPANDTSPSWSPRGNKIAFISNRDGDYDIYVMNADGSNLTSITSNSQDNFSLKWSPDNQWIAYRETTGEHETDLYISEVDGTKDPIKIFSHPGAYDWAPDGTEIVVSKPELFGDLYVVNAESGEARELKVNSIDNYDWPAGLDWSPCTH